MDTFLEDLVLPELVKDSDKDRLESEIISLREKINEESKYRNNNISEKPMLPEDYKFISDFVKENSGHEEFLKNREELYSKHKPEFNFYWDKLILEMSKNEPIITLVDGNGKDESYYHLDMKSGKPEILLGGESRHDMVGLYGHEYTHHTQMFTSSDIMGLLDGLNNDDKDCSHGTFRVLREGQAIKIEEEISRLYSNKENDTNYSRFISNDILRSMTKVYNALNCRGKSKALGNSFAIKNNESVRDEEIGITYFKLNNLNPKDYYKEFTDRFVK